MKTKILSIACILTLNLHAIDFPVSNTNISTLTSTLSSSNYQSLINIDSALFSDAQSGIDSVKSSTLSNVYKSLAGQLGGSVNLIGGDILGMCYVYKPAPATSIDSSLNICDLLGSATTDPCQLAPELSDFGYYKKSNTSTQFTELKDYCNSIFGKNSSSTTTQERTTTLTEINTNDYIVTETQNTTDIAEATKNTTKIESSPLDIKKATGNNIITDVIYNNKPESFDLLKKIYKNNPNALNNIDTTQINVEYKTNEEFEESIDELKSTYYNLYTQLNKDEIYKLALQQFERVNANTSDATERATQKESLKASMIEDYKKILAKWEKLEYEKRYLMLDKKDFIAYPTQDIVKRYDAVNRLYVVSLIEKQKTKIAELRADIKKESLNMLNEVEIYIDNARTRTQEFDRAKALQEIEALIGS